MDYCSSCATEIFYCLMLHTVNVKRIKRGVATFVFSFSKTSCCGCPHVQEFFLLRRSLNGCEIWERLGENLPIWLIIPKNLLNCVTEVGSVIFVIAIVF